MNLKNLFIVSDEKDKPVSKEPVVTKAEKSVEVPVSQPTSANAGDVDKMKEFLIGKIVSESEGFDYFKFHSAVKELIQSGQAEETAFNSVYVTAKAMGITKTKLLTSARSYLASLATEKGCKKI